MHSRSGHSLLPVSRTLPFLCLLLTILFSPVSILPAPADKSSPRILLLNSYHPGYSWSDSIVQGVRAGLAEAGREIDLSVEYLDTKRYPPELLAPHYTRLLTAKYPSRSIDLIIVADNNGLSFLLANRETLFPNIPVVFCGINNFSKSMIAGQDNITGIAEDHDLSGTIRLARALQPGRTNLVAVADSSESGRENLAAFRRAAGEVPGVTVSELAGLSTEELAQQLRRLPANSVLFHLDFYRDSTGRFLTLPESFRLLTDNSTLPVYVNTDNKMGFGALGGIVTSGFLMGKAAAGLARRIIGGEPAGSIPIQLHSPRVTVFDYRMLDRFGLGLQDLPPAATIMNKPDPFFFKYRKLLWSAAIFSTLLTLIILLLAYHLRKRRQWAGEATSWSYIFNNARWGLAVGDFQTKKLVTVNAAFADMHGFNREKITDIPISELYAPECRPALAEHIATIREKGRHRFESTHLRGDGSSFPVMVDATIIPDNKDSPSRYMVNVVDISAQKAVESHLQESLTHLSALHSLSSRIVNLRSLTGVADTALGMLAATTGTDLTLLFLLKDGELVEIDSFSAAPVQRNAEPGSHRIGVCLCGLAAQGKPVYSDNIHSDSRCTLRECKSAGFKSLAALPLRDGETVIGVLGFATRKERDFSRDADFLETLADQTAMGVKNVLLYEELRKFADEQEELVRERTADLEKKNRKLEKLNRLFVEREFRIKELRDKVARLERR